MAGSDHSSCILYGPKYENKINPKGVGWALFENMKIHSTRIAQIDALTGIKDTYGFLLERCIKTAIEMRKRGIKSNDIITIISYNHLNSVVPFVAGLFLHCKVSTLDPSMAKDDIKYLLNQVEPKMIFAEHTAEHLVEYALKESKFKTEIVSFGQNEKYGRFTDFLKASPEEEAFEPIPCKSLKDTVLILFSSGTTGLPKGICLHHYGLLSQNVISEDHTFKPFVILSFSSLYWISAAGMVIGAASSGSARVIVPKFNESTVWDVTNIYKPNVLFLAPCQILEMVKNGIPKTFDINTFKFVLVGGGSITKNQMVSLKQMFPKSLVIQGYGMTEICGTVANFDPENPDHLKMLMSKPDSVGTISKNVSYKEFLKASPEEEAFEPIPCKSLKDTVLILFSSGTTGLPKGICLHHYGLLSQNVISEDHTFKPFVILSFSSLYWISAAGMVIGAASSGSARVIVPKFNESTVWDVTNIYKPNVLFLAPCQILEMVKNGIPKTFDINTFKFVLVGGGSITKNQMVSLKQMFPKSLVIQGYGMTEICGTVANFDPENPDHLKMLMSKPDSVGTISKNVSYKVVDPETEEVLGLNQKGELRLKTEYELNGYYNRDSTDIWDKEGWLKTGDIVYFDENLCLYHVDRIKEMFKYKSWHIIPKKLETIIAGHPDVADVVVIGLPHPEDGEHPCAVVILKPNATATAEEIRKFTDDQLEDRDKIRGGVKFVERFPVTPTGKIRRLELKKQIISAL